MSSTLYVHGGALTDEQQAALEKLIRGRSNMGAGGSITFAADGESLTVPHEEGWPLRHLVQTINSEHARWDRGVTPRRIISDSDTPESLAELIARHRAIPQG